jgi:hypothetical protein
MHACLERQGHALKEALTRAASFKSMDACMRAYRGTAFTTASLRVCMYACSSEALPLLLPL